MKRLLTTAVIVTGVLVAGAMVFALPTFAAPQITTTYTVTDTNAATGPTATGLLNITNFTLPATLGTEGALTNFFTLNPTSSGSTSHDGTTSYHNCISGTGCSGTTETTAITVHFTANLVITGLPSGGQQSLALNDMGGTFTAQYDPKLSELACAAGDGGPNPGQSDCFIWTGSNLSTYQGFAEQVYALAGGYQLDVFLYNASDWSITPQVAFEVQKAPGGSSTGAPEPASLSLLGIGVLGLVGIVAKRRRS